MVDLLLFLVAAYAAIYCCNLPAFIDTPLLVADKESLWYIICAGIIPAYIFHLVQVILPECLERKKNRAYLRHFLCKLKDKMQGTVAIMIGTNNQPDDPDAIMTMAEQLLKEKDIFTDGSRFNWANMELTIIDALQFNQEEVHTLILEMISLNILDKKNNETFAGY